MLAAWLRVTTSVSQVHQLRDLRYNEALICNILMKNEIEHPGRRLTATDLCRESHILKSQMNRTLQCMEEKGIIERQRSTEDRRRVYTRLRPDSVIYERQHDQVLDTAAASPPAWAPTTSTRSWTCSTPSVRRPRRSPARAPALTKRGGPPWPTPDAVPQGTARLPKGPMGNRTPSAPFIYREIGFP